MEVYQGIHAFSLNFINLKIAILNILEFEKYLSLSGISGKNYLKIARPIFKSGTFGSGPQPISNSYDSDTISLFFYN